MKLPRDSAERAENDLEGLEVEGIKRDIEALSSRVQATMRYFNGRECQRS